MKQSPFGFRFLDFAEKTQKVLNVFSNVASSYDVMNDLMSAGTHRLWKRHFVDQLPLRPDIKILDLATGTGDIAIKILSKAKNDNLDVEVLGVDPNEDMLKNAKIKAYDSGVVGIKWLKASAESLPFEDGTFDLCTISFGLRNTTDIDESLREIRRVLKPGAGFFCIEFSTPTSPLVSIPYELYSFAVIPLMGQIVTGDKASYQYLVESIKTFPPQEALLEKMKTAGFSSVSFENLMNGIVAIHKGWA